MTIALLPPLTVATALLVQEAGRYDAAARERATADLRKVLALRDQLRRDLEAAIFRAHESEWYVMTNEALGRSDTARVAVDPSAFGLDFLELTDVGNRVVASSISPARIGLDVELTNVRMVSGRLVLSERMEQDSAGTGPVLAARLQGDGVVNVYGGFDLRRHFLPKVDSITGGATRVIMERDPGADAARCRELEVGKVYKHAGRYEAVTCGSQSARFYALTEFRPPARSLVSGQTLLLVGLTALLSVAIAFGMGRFFVARAAAAAQSSLSEPQSDE